MCGVVYSIDFKLVYIFSTGSWLVHDILTCAYGDSEKYSLSAKDSP